MKNEEKKVFLRNIPSIEKLLSAEEFTNLSQFYPRKLIVKITRNYIEELRVKYLYDTADELPDCSVENIYLQVKRELEKWHRGGLKRAINAAGVPLHTNLGRSPLCKRALERLEEILHSYCTLEIDSETGKRGARHKRVEELFLELTGAEAAAVVNNASAAIYLVLQRFAKNKEVIISRGELVEIGGGFRIPEVMKKSGCHLVEVGTTNKTRIQDYKDAITPDTAMILKVHTSNFKMIGFTESVSLEELIKLAKSEKIPLFYDQGNGLMVNLRPFGFDHELNVIESINAGVDIIAFSGDKLFGGPQAGIILSKKEYMEQIKIDPMMRALRLDKMSLACLEATLEEYLFTEKAVETIPILNMLTINKEKLKNKAEELVEKINSIKGAEEKISLSEGFSEIGGGTFPGFYLPTFLVSIKSPSGAKIIQEKLRLQKPSIYSRIEEEQILLDIRTLMNEKDRDDLLFGLKQVFGY